MKYNSNEGKTATGINTKRCTVEEKSDSHPIETI